MRLFDAATRFPWRILSVLLFIALIPGTLMVGAGSPLSVQGAALVQTSMSLSPVSLAVPVQTAFAVDIVVDCGANADGAAAVVTFDPACLQVVSVTSAASAFPRVLRNLYDNGTGIVWYDAGAELGCHASGSCPSGVARLATVNFRVVTLTPQQTYIALRGQVTWSGEYTFDGEGSGSAVTIVGPSFTLYLPLLMHSYAH